MSNLNQKSRFNGLFRAIAIFVLSTFISTGIMPIPVVSAQELNLPVPGTMVRMTPAFEPALIQGIKISPTDPLLFNFLIDPGQVPLSQQEKKDEYHRLITYFLAALTTPEKDMWVNLSPYEHGRIISLNFGHTEMGRDMLAQDYILKQLSASLVYPEDGLGKKFWDTVYEKIREQNGGNTEIPVNTFNKVWIVPDTATVFEKGNVALITQSHLKVLMEEDYLSLNKHDNAAKMGLNDANSLPNNSHQISSAVMRQIIIPAVEQEINEGKNFAQLRQMYNSMILAAWFKKTLKMHLLSTIYVNKGKDKGVELQNPQDNEKIFQRYLKAYKRGVYNYIKEETDPTSGAVIPRKYFSGGFTAQAMLSRVQTTQNSSALGSFFTGARDTVKVKLGALVVGGAILFAGSVTAHAGGVNATGTSLQKGPMVVQGFTAPIRAPSAPIHLATLLQNGPMVVHGSNGVVTPTAPTHIGIGLTTHTSTPAPTPTPTVTPSGAGLTPGGTIAPIVPVASTDISNHVSTTSTHAPSATFHSGTLSQNGPMVVQGTTGAIQPSSAPIHLATLLHGSTGPVTHPTPLLGTIHANPIKLLIANISSTGHVSTVTGGSTPPPPPHQPHQVGEGQGSALSQFYTAIGGAGSLTLTLNNGAALYNVKPVGLFELDNLNMTDKVHYTSEHGISSRTIIFNERNIHQLIWTRGNVKYVFNLGPDGTWDVTSRFVTRHHHEVERTLAAGPVFVWGEGKWIFHHGVAPVGKGIAKGAVYTLHGTTWTYSKTIKPVGEGIAEGPTVTLKGAKWVFDHGLKPVGKDIAVGTVETWDGTKWTLGEIGKGPKAIWNGTEWVLDHGLEPIGKDIAVGTVYTWDGTKWTAGEIGEGPKAMWNGTKWVFDYGVAPVGKGIAVGAVYTWKGPEWVYDKGIKPLGEGSPAWNGIATAPGTRPYGAVLLKVKTPLPAHATVIYPNSLTLSTGQVLSLGDNVRDSYGKIIQHVIKLKLTEKGGEFQSVVIYGRHGSDDIKNVADLNAIAVNPVLPQHQAKLAKVKVAKVKVAKVKVAKAKTPKVHHQKTLAPTMIEFPIKTISIDSDVLRDLIAQFNSIVRSNPSVDQNQVGQIFDDIQTYRQNIKSIGRGTAVIGETDKLAEKIREELSRLKNNIGSVQLPTTNLINNPTSIVVPAPQVTVTNLPSVTSTNQPSSSIVQLPVVQPVNSNLPVVTVPNQPSVAPATNLAPPAVEPTWLPVVPLINTNGLPDQIVNGVEDVNDVISNHTTGLTSQQIEAVRKVVDNFRKKYIREKDAVDAINSIIHPMPLSSDNGGIDFDSSYLKMNLQGDSAQIIAPRGFEWLLNAPISGFIPKILDIRSGAGFDLAFFKGMLNPQEQREAQANPSASRMVHDQMAMKEPGRESHLVADVSA